MKEKNLNTLQLGIRVFSSFFSCLRLIASPHLFSTLTSSPMSENEMLLLKSTDDDNNSNSIWLKFKIFLL